MSKLFSLAAVAALSMGAVASQAADLTFAVGQSGESTMVYRVGVQCDFGTLRSYQSGRLTGYWDTGYTYWEGDETSSSHSLSISPVFVYEFAGESVKPYVEGAIGLAAFSNTEVEDNDLGSSLQFEDRLGVGLRFAGQEVGLRAVHYSNAGLKNPNDGVEAYTLHYRLSF